VPASLAERDEFYPVLGYLVGSIAGDDIPVIDGLTARPTDDQLKAFSAAAATSGSVALFHIIGVTPEAPTLADAFGGAPQRALDIGLTELRHARAELTTTVGDALDLVAFGSPHCSLAECRALGALMAGQRSAPAVEVFVTTSRAVRNLLERSGELARLTDFGAKVTADTCIVVSPLIRAGSRVMMTNSAKYAHYAPGLLGVGAVYGSTDDCVASAIAGRVVVDDSAWMG
jgi:hypothetical protein